MRDKGHIRIAAFCRKNTDICMLLQSIEELSPLGKGAITRGPMQISGHPGIDDVVDVIPLWRTHQVGRTIKMWE